MLPRVSKEEAAAEAFPISPLSHSITQTNASTSGKGLLPQTLKMPVSFKEDGSNLPVWDVALPSAHDARGCMPALLQTMSRMPENSASLMLILSRVPEEWHGSLAELESSYDAYRWTHQQFTGGHILDATIRWKTELEKGILPGQTLAQYYRRMCNVQKYLQCNGHTTLDGEISVAIIKGLPKEAKEPVMFVAAGAYVYLRKSC